MFYLSIFCKIYFLILWYNGWHFSVLEPLFWRPDKRYSMYYITMKYMRIKGQNIVWKCRLARTSKRKVQNLNIRYFFSWCFISGGRKGHRNEYRKVASSRPVYYSIFDQFWGATKGQLISKCLSAVVVWTKYQRKYFRDFCFLKFI